MIGATIDRADAVFDHRFASRPGWVAMTELFLAIAWLRSVGAKIFLTEWWTGAELKDFIVENEAHTIAWYEPVLDTLVVDNAAAWAGLVLALEVAIAVALLSSVRMGFGLVAALFLNVNFVLVGATNPSVFYLLLQLALVLWMLESADNPATSQRWLRAMVFGGAIFALACIPYATTMHPDRVVDDPGLVLATWAICGVVAAATAHRRIRRRELRAGTIDLRERPVAV